jgi:hypothetical protein
MESLGKVMKGDQVLAHPDHGARSAYEARMTRTIEAQSAPEPKAAEPVADAPAASTAAEQSNGGNGHGAADAPERHAETV